MGLSVPKRRVWGQHYPASDSNNCVLSFDSLAVSVSQMLGRICWLLVICNNVGVTVPSLAALVWLMLLILGFNVSNSLQSQ